MKLFNLFKKKSSSFEFNHENCQKAQQRGQELTTLLHPQIEGLLAKYYSNELKSSYFQEKKTDAKGVFEAACVGLSIITLADLIETNKGSAEILKECLKSYQEIYAKIKLGYIYNNVLKFVQDYKYFTESNVYEQIKDRTTIGACFTGAWVTWYYLGEETVIEYDSSIEIGKIIEETIHDLWVAKNK